MLRFNFAERKESAYAKYIRPDIVFLVFVLSTVLIGSYIYANSIQQRIEKTQKRIVKLEGEIRRLKQIQRKEKELISAKKELQRKLEVVSRLDRNRKVPQFLYFFAKPSNVKYVWLSKLDYSGDQLRLTGGTQDINKFPVFLKIVEDDLGKVLFRKTERQVYVNKLINFTAIYYKFNFVVRLKNGSTD